MTDPEARHARIRQKLMTGELPSTEPDAGLRLSSFLFAGAARKGVSEGTACSACDEPIKPGEMMVDFSYMSGRVLCFHEDCATFWNDQRLSRGGGAAAVPSRGTLSLARGHDEGRQRARRDGHHEMRGQPGLPLTTPIIA